MSLTRKDFCQSLVSGVALLAISACGGGGGDGGGTFTPTPSPTPSPAGSCGSTGAAITANHGHELSFARTNLDSPTAVTLSIAGSAGHDHSITLSTANMATLKAGGSVTVTSTTTNIHDHAVTVTCI
jgi:hypothetical protein